MKHAQTRKWNDVYTFPVPGVFLLVRLANGTEVVGIRPEYVRTYNDDPQYKTPEGEPINGVQKWSIL